MFRSLRYYLYLYRAQKHYICLTGNLIFQFGLNCPLFFRILCYDIEAFFKIQINNYRLLFIMKLFLLSVWKNCLYFDFEAYVLYLWGTHHLKWQKSLSNCFNLEKGTLLELTDTHIHIQNIDIEAPSWIRCRTSILRSPSLHVHLLVFFSVVIQVFLPSAGQL